MPLTIYKVESESSMVEVRVKYDYCNILIDNVHRVSNMNECE